MKTKPSKSAPELAAIRSCASIQSVVVTPAPRAVSHHPNWNAAFVTSGAELAPQIAFQTAREIAAEYDLAE
jgi:hypothetical protein